MTTSTTQLRSALPRKFYDRDPRRVSRELLGKVLVRKAGKEFLAARIVEVEAYLEGDPAAHSFVGRTPRNAVLFGPPGHAYVYFIYGSHYCLNVSCLADGVAGGILFRAAEPMLGIGQMARARGVTLPESGDHADNHSFAPHEDARPPLGLRRVLRNLTSGPGRLAEAFGITRERDNNVDLTNTRSGLFIADDGYRVRKTLITPRIGITKAAERRLRYLIAGNEFVSGPKTRGPSGSRVR